MSQWVDLKELRKQLDFADVLRHYGVGLKPKDDQHHGFCPLPKHKGKRNSPSFSANLKRGIWQCFGCGAKGNVLDFAVLMEGADPKKGEDVRGIASQLHEQFLTGSPSAKTKSEQKDSEEEKSVVNAPLDFELKGLDASHPYLRSRGFSDETVERFGLGYCSRGLLAKRIAIPLHDTAGNLVGYAGRLVNEEEISEDNPKYKFPGRRKRRGVIHDFRKSLLVYNANQISQTNRLVVVEGFTSVWWLKQSGINEAVSLMGANCSEEQGQIIVSRVTAEGCVLIFTDGDAAGERCAQDIFIHVAPQRSVRWVRVEDGKQPTDFSASELDLLLWRRRT